MLALCEGAQSLWYPYEKKENINSGSKSVNKCHKSRLKNGELLLAAARQLMLDSTVTPEIMAKELQVTVRSINTVLKKLRDNFDQDLAILGLNNLEMENLRRVIHIRDVLKSGDKTQTICDMFDSGQSIGEIAKTENMSRKKLLALLKENGRDANKIIKLMYIEEHKTIPEICNKAGMSRKSIVEILNEVDGETKRRVIVNDDIDYNGKKFSIKKGMMPPSKPKNRKAPAKRPASIGAAGLAWWNYQHYDPVTGKNKLPPTSIPADMPRRFPRPNSDVYTPAEPRESFFPAPPISKSECTVRGRRRIGIMMFD